MSGADTRQACDYAAFASTEFASTIGGDSLTASMTIVVPECAFDPLKAFSALVSDVAAAYADEATSAPWIVAFSGGKDSTILADIVFQALLETSPSRRTRPIHIVSNDTLVESPLVMGHLRVVQSEIAEAARVLNLPITVVTTQPTVDQSFWVNLIGRGYPSPNRTMRWCTDRLKITPTSNYVVESVNQNGAVVIVLGVRRDESATRRQSIDKRGEDNPNTFTRHDSLLGAWVYRPIMNVSTDQVWEMLASKSPSWGGSHTALITLYREASGGECPVVMSADDAPGCGTNSSRFGCWTCTVVEKDKSLQGFVDIGTHEFMPLLDFRDWLKSIRNEPAMRSSIRRNGVLTFNPGGKHIPGPFTVNARRMILDRLLQTQQAFGTELVTAAELDRIQQIWSQDLLTEHGTLADAA